MSMWDMYTSESPNIFTTEKNSPNGYEFTQTASGNDWWESLSNTAIKGLGALTEYERAKNNGNVAQQQTAREYENIQQKTVSNPSSNIPNIDKNTLIYAGVGLAAAYLIFGGK